MDDVYLLDVYTELFAWVGPESNEQEKSMVMGLAQEYIKSAGADRQGTSITKVEAGKEPPHFTCHFLGWDHSQAQVFEDPYEMKMRELEDKRNSMPAETPSPFSNVQLKRRETTSSPGVKESSQTSQPFAQVQLKHRDFNNSSAPTPEEKGNSAANPFAIKLKSTGFKYEEPPAPEVTPVASNPAATPAPEPDPANYVDHSTTKFTYAELKARGPEIEAKVNPVFRHMYLSDQEFEQILQMPKSQFETLKKWKQDDLRRKVGLF
mmetsp:Transcript_12933/g.20311  ORF Transcript_12933/g.20311 Transcript_12933/m.20311 type:complete len:264 (+) Transcript_12933:27-818(+)|eukprot:CAMPEP_0184320962 /NCGR_PEP_ID=MMETSP1049-20130417/116675_1 /TAXON_ID=77928 /ORGANISM="Proteomonas sulcata, Strain CCMP704" /LENGTH=263 /DNA_ID=CAMNT_0026641629 /DNA_START=26 /DNA_END=817 /DNA_ORIENTATION=-